MAASTACFSSPVTVAELDIHVNDPIQHLLNCHQKIERSLIIVENAVNSLTLTVPALRAEAVAALDYELALLQLLANLHAQDEDQSTFPRLRARLGNDPERLGTLIESLEVQHREEHIVFVELGACVWEILAKGGSAGDDQLAELDALVERLAGIYRHQITAENERVIPSCRQRLTQADFDGMREEMRKRYNE